MWVTSEPSGRTQVLLADIGMMRCRRQSACAEFNPTPIHAWCTIARLPTGRHGHIDRDGEVEDFGSELRGKISSISVPAGCQLKAYDRKDLAGRERTYGAGKVQLTGSRWDNKISSAQCQCSPQESVKPVVGTTSEPRSCVMYENTRRSGEQLSLKEQTGFRWVGGDWKDRVSSAVVPEFCELRVYRERDYGGDEKVLQDRYARSAWFWLE